MPLGQDAAVIARHYYGAATERLRTLLPLSGGVTTDEATSGVRYLFGTAADIELQSRRTVPLHNTIVRACVAAITNPVLQAEPMVWQGAAQQAGHPLVELLLNPCPGCPETLFMTQLVESFIGTGNAIYEIKQAVGQPVELHFIPAAAVKVVDEDAEVYQVQTRKRGMRRIAARDILHLRYSLSYAGGIMGRSPLQGLVLDEIGLDHRVVQLLSSYMANRGSPGVVIMPKDNAKGESHFEQDELKEAEKLMNSFTGGRAGLAATFNRPIDIIQLASAFERTGIADFRQGPASNICAVLRVPPSLALVDASKRQSGLFWGDTTQSEVEAFYRDTINGLLRNLSQQIDAQLLQRFYDPEGTTEFAYIPPEPPAPLADQTAADAAAAQPENQAESE